MALSEIDSFILKFKNLLHSGNTSNLTLRSEAGKAFITLTVEVDQHARPSHLHLRSRNGPTRQRRRQRRAEDREAAAKEAAAKEIDPQRIKSTPVEESKEPEKEAIKPNLNKSAEEAKVEGNGSQAVLIEPCDEIEKEKISIETKKPKSSEMCSTVSIFPIRNINANSDYLQKAIIAKLEEKNVKVKDSYIQRTPQGTFIKCDVLIEPHNGRYKF